MIKIYKTTFEGLIEWRRKDNGLLHNDNRPAIEFANGTNMWYQNGKRHRLDGPAIECYYGDKEYYLNGKYYPNIKTDEEWIIFQIIN